MIRLLKKAMQFVCLALMLVVLISALLPILRRTGLVDRSTPAKITW